MGSLLQAFRRVYNCVSQRGVLELKDEQKDTYFSPSSLFTHSFTSPYVPRPRCCLTVYWLMRCSPDNPQSNPRVMATKVPPYQYALRSARAISRFVSHKNKNINKTKQNKKALKVVYRHVVYDDFRLLFSIAHTKEKKTKWKGSTHPHLRRHWQHLIQPYTNEWM